VNNAPPLHPKDIAYVVYAPWRSLIYRNTDDAFAYEDDLALFPHMPMNTAGFDPRARQILGDWMVSIPAIRKQPGLVEYAYRTVLDENAGDPVAIQNKDNIGSFFVDTSPQPYAEVPPGSPGYDAAKAAAQERLAIWHTGINPAIPVDTDAGTSFIYSRYADPGANDDIFDPNLNSCTPIPPAEVLFPDFGSGNTAIPPPGLPDWVDSDLTEPPGDWVPRQPNWTSILFQPSTQAFDSACLSSTTSSSDAGSPLCPPESTGNACGATGAAAAYADQLEAISLLQDTYLSQVEPFATTALPFGLWKKDPGCTFPGVPRAKQFLAASPPPHWMTIANPPLDPEAPVYTQTPGAAVFKMICVNCHGPRADASGRLALNLATMTGGNALVADWRDGIFGPVGTSEADSNRHAVFGLPGSDNPRSELPANPPANWAAPEATDDDRAARYMAWMALGGTNVTIPQGILDIVAVTPVLSEHRVVPAYALSANMLSEAKNLCYTILQPSSPQPPYFYPGEGNGYLLPRTFNALNGQLLLDIGDAEMWLQLCSTGNPSPVHVLQLTKIGQILATGAAPGALISPGTYPQGFPVGNVNGTVDSSLSPTNEWPWCVDDRLNDDGTAPTAAQINALGAADACGTKACSNVPSTDPNYDPFCDCTMHPDGCPACVCPGSVTTKSEVCAVSCPSSSGKPTCLADKGLDSECLSAADANRWAVRGAINAGLSVYLYAKSIENTTPPPDYNQCSQLTAK
jgi:mono/diheme cytochrome c family protein